jgi:hypothetical protein
MSFWADLVCWRVNFESYLREEERKEQGDELQLQLQEEEEEEEVAERERAETYSHAGA